MVGPHCALVKVAESARGRQNEFGQFWAGEFGHEATVMPSSARGRAQGGSRGETEAKAEEERGSRPFAFRNDPRFFE